MAFSELIKNFHNIRSYMRDFYIYGFKTREEYDKKSARSYDNERRRIQSYLGDLVSFRQTASGKNMFISLDGRNEPHNPLYAAFKSKSFTNKDITLHFIIMDILADGDPYTMKELLEIIDTEYLSEFDNTMSFDESTLRKKLKEYEELGIVIKEKRGKNVAYNIVKDTVDLEKYRDAIRFFTEENILGVVGSYIEDKIGLGEEFLIFKNHYIMNAYDSEVIEGILRGIHEKRIIKIKNFGRKSKQEIESNVIPIKLYVSTQGGRNYLMCYDVKNGKPVSIRIDYIEKVEVKELVEDYEKYSKNFKDVASHMWGASCKGTRVYEHIEMDIFVGANEDFIVRRLEREHRCGRITKIDDETYRFSADVFDAYELVPWIRTYFGRIKSLKCDNEKVMNQLKFDVVAVAKQYGEIE